MKKIIILMACTLVAGPLDLWGAKSEPIAVIVNKSITVDSLTLDELSKIYKGQIEKWPDGQKIFVIDRPVDSNVRAWFYKMVLRTKPGRIFFKPGSPVTFKKMELKRSSSVSRMVASIPNAIAYLYLSDINKKQKILKIEGVLPTENKYKLVINP